MSGGQENLRVVLPAVRYWDLLGVGPRLVVAGPRVVYAAFAVGGAVWLVMKLVGPGASWMNGVAPNVLALVVAAMVGVLGLLAAIAVGSVRQVIRLYRRVGTELWVEGGELVRRRGRSLQRILIKRGDRLVVFGRMRGEEKGLAALSLARKGGKEVLLAEGYGREQILSAAAALERQLSPMGVALEDRMAPRESCGDVDGGGESAGG